MTLALHERVENLLVKERMQIRRTAPHKDGDNKLVAMAYDRNSASQVHVGDDVDMAPELKWITCTLADGQRKVRDKIEHPSYAAAFAHFESELKGGKWRL